LNPGTACLESEDRGPAIEECKILKDPDRDKANRLFHPIYE